MLRLLFALAGLGVFTGTIRAADEYVTTPSGLKYQILVHGSGAQPKVGQVVLANYVGTLPDGTEFDRTKDEPFAFTLGQHQVIKGWDEGFALLHVGDKAVFVIPPALGYGAKAIGPIPANSTLSFQVELVAIKEGALADALKEVIDRDGLTAAESRFAEWKANHFGRYFPDEGQLNALGYHYLQGGKLPEALAVLGWNVELFPNSANVYDSVAEAEVKNGDAAAAIRDYAKSFELDPKNSNAAAMLAELRSSPGAIEAMRERMRLQDDLEAAFTAQEQGKPIDLPSLRRRVLDVVARNPAADADGNLVNNYLYLSESIDLHGAVQDWKLFVDSPNEKVRELAHDKMGLAGVLNAPLELKFKAADGREVDVAQLRGKVVLVDFWATWCGPCREEIPNVVAAYNQLHAQGFEIVGVTFDQAPDPEHPAKRQKTAGQVLAFTQENGMTWPQYYDGTYWKNPFGQRFGIRAIPAMFLLDKTGMIVSTNARGSKLATEVKRLLAQPAAPTKS
ncbi:MAG TPA: FKBP-type peptidyl-prolyl cis-trans isomerase [Candidatus Didemnitutus sp.]|nr:FKBP-type peptidyl-prolyl cis-trans isomerase [Candidatus Didemnitutus sp.]